MECGQEANSDRIWTMSVRLRATRLALTVPVVGLVLAALAAPAVAGDFTVREIGQRDPALRQVEELADPRRQVRVCATAKDLQFSHSP